MTLTIQIWRKLCGSAEISFARFTVLSSAAAGRRSRERSVSARWECVESMISSTLEDTGRSARMRKCESSWIKKSLPKTASARSAKKSSPTIPTSYPTISIPVAWEERGETTILRTFRRSTGGAMGKRDRAGGDLSPECCRPCSVVRKVPEVGSSDLAGTTLSDKLSLTAHLLLSCASATRIELHLHHNDLQSPLRTAEQNAFG